MEESQEVMQLKSELKTIQEKYLNIQAKDRKNRGHSAKEIHKIESFLYETRSRLKRVKPLRKKLENMYKHNLILRTKVRELNKNMNERRRKIETRGLDLLVQATLI